MPRCIIHIGHAKTATTYLQHCLHLNQSLFAKHSYWIPSDFRPLGFHDLGQLTREGKVIDGNLSPLHQVLSHPDRPGLQTMLDYMFTAATMKPGADVILSSELFFYYPNAVADVAKFARNYGLDPTIVAYIERQDRAAISAYLQNVRNHDYGFGVIDFLVANNSRNYCRYRRAVEEIVTKCPAVPIILRSFHRPFLTDGDIFSDFLTTFDCRLPSTACARPPKFSNSGLTVEQYELLRAANVLLRPDVAVRLRIAQQDLSPEDRERIQGFYYTRSVHAHLATHYLQGNFDLLKLYMPHATPDERRYWTELTLPPDTPEPLNDSLFATLRTNIFGA